MQMRNILGGVAGQSGLRFNIAKKHCSGISSGRDSFGEGQARLHKNTFDRAPDPWSFQKTQKIKLSTRIHIKIFIKKSSSVKSPLAELERSLLPGFRKLFWWVVMKIWKCQISYPIRKRSLCIFWANFLERRANLIKCKIKIFFTQLSYIGSVTTSVVPALLSSQGIATLITDDEEGKHKKEAKLKFKSLENWVTFFLPRTQKSSQEEENKTEERPCNND